MLTRSEAAIYCGISIGVFSQVCFVQPVDFGRDARSLRWDRKLLDAWLDELGPGPERLSDEYLLAKLDEGAKLEKAIKEAAKAAKRAAADERQRLVEQRRRDRETRRQSRP